MRHDPDLDQARARAERHARLFSLHAQTDLQAAPDPEEFRVLSPGFARLIQARALLSLGSGSEDADIQLMIDTMAARRD